MANVKLVAPTVELKDEYLDMIDEWRQSGEEMVPFVLKFDTTDFHAMIRKLEDYSKGIGLESGFVEHSTYWLVREDNKVLGTVNIRHRLNENLLKVGGNIGYGIRPSERRKGYAAKMLSLALNITRAMGMERALVTCDEDNIGSERTILKNGGVFESSVEEDGKAVKRFWINLN